MNKLLISEPPLQVLPSLAEKIGLNEAILLQQIHYWRQKSSNTEPDESGVERKWVYKTLDEWTSEMPFWSTSTVRRAISSLREQNLIVTESKRAEQGDPTTWYAIKYSELDTLGQEDAPPSVQDEHHPSVQNEQEGDPPSVQDEHHPLFKMNNSGGVQDEQLRSAHYARAYTENTREYIQRESVCEDEENKGQPSSEKGSSQVDGLSEENSQADKTKQSSWSDEEKLPDSESTGSTPSSEGDELPGNWQKPQVSELNLSGDSSTAPPGPSADGTEAPPKEDEEAAPTRDSDPDGVRAWVEIVGERPTISQREKLRTIFQGERAAAWDEHVFKETLDNAILSCDGDAYRIDFGRFRQDYKRNLRQNDHPQPESNSSAQGGRVPVMADGKIGRNDPPPEYESPWVDVEEDSDPSGRAAS